ncbi:glycosyltransferase family 2 protein [Pontibacter diazotrophicus]|uniref:Glycosyltransferase family 2 protein n=2 Tax=Pontibacter diazotrophicus TaxID=1400979 RepID=A0A3D8LBU5_9BACT|nr:glycosyltransferase family 2 protein [Pontibacter diazotrophicus]
MLSLVSVIVPCYNYGHYLAEALDSVLSQTYKEWECIIVNDGSTDHTEEVALSFCGQDNRFKYIFQENQGVVTARNSALQIARGKYILPLDGDDKIHSRYIEKGIEVLENNEGVKVVYCKAAYFGELTGEIVLKPYTFENLLIRNMIFCTALHRKADSDKVGGYNSFMNKGLEDWDYWISILKEGGEAYQIPEILFYYRRRNGTRSDSFTFAEEANIRIQVYEKHHEAYTRMIGDPIHMLREKERLAKDLRNIRSRIIYKVFRNLRLLP